MLIGSYFTFWMLNQWCYNQVQKLVLQRYLLQLILRGQCKEVNCTDPFPSARSPWDKRTSLFLPPRRQWRRRVWWDWHLSSSSSSSVSSSLLPLDSSLWRSAFFLAWAISAACFFRHLVRRFWNQTWNEMEKCTLRYVCACDFQLRFWSHSTLKVLKHVRLDRRIARVNAPSYRMFSLSCLFRDLAANKHQPFRVIWSKTIWPKDILSTHSVKKRLAGP